MSIHVQLERFEGPLGLLLHLIREQEMDVFNINVHEITRQYLEYIKAMRRLDLEVAGEFVAMAATLIHIKSRSLLPQYNEEGEEIHEDPRKELVQKLVEYKKFQEISAELYKRPLLGRDVLTRAEREKLEPTKDAELVLDENPLFSLIAAYRAAVKNMKQGVHKVASELQSIASRILEMKDLLVIGRRLLFTQLLDPNAEAKGNHVLVTFISLLELAKMGFISVFQSEPLADIHVEPKRAVDRDVVSQVESYDAVHAADVANSIMSEALSLSEPTGADEDEVPVVEAAYADAASDDDIAAEEARLFASEPASTDEVTVIEFTNASEEPAVASTEAAPVESAALFANESLVVADATSDFTAPDVSEGSAPSTEEIAVAPTGDAPALDAFSVPDAPAPVIDETLLSAVADGEPEIDASVIESQVCAAAEPVVASTEAPSVTDDVAREKLSSALNAALSAFDAFEDITPDRSSEVES